MARKRTRTAPTRPNPKPAAVPAAAPTRSVPILDADDLQLILHDLSATLAPGDVVDLLQLEPRLRARAARLKTPEMALLRAQLDFALEFLHDEIDGACPQIPYSTVSMIAAAVCYFADEVDVIPDFLPRIGKLDDAAVMAMAFALAEDGIRRYCTWKGRPVAPLFTRQQAPRPAAPAARSTRSRST